MANKWTEDEESTLLRLRAEGFTAKEMTLYLKDRSYAAIRARLSKISTDNLNRFWTPEETELVLRLKEEGKSLKFIARAVERTPRAVSSHIYRYWENLASKPSV